MRGGRVRQANNGDPYFLKAKYEGTCPETGLKIRKGDECVYFPKSRKAYHRDSKAAQQVREMKFAESWGMGDAAW